MYVFVHGIGGRATQFDPLIEALALSADQVCTPQLPNHGEESEDHDWLDYAEADWKGALRLTGSYIANQISSCDVLVGHSTGGVVAMQMVAMAEVRASRLVIIDSNAPVSSPAIDAKVKKARIAERLDWRSEMKRSLERDWVGSGLWRQRVFNDLDRTEDLPMRWIWKAVLNADSETLWRMLNIPTLYIRSTRTLTGAELLAVNEGTAFADVSSGHWPHISAPDRVAKAIVKWL